MAHLKRNLGKYLGLAAAAAAAYYGVDVEQAKAALEAVRSILQ